MRKEYKMNLKYVALVLLFICGCGINPERTYKVYTVIDSNGKTYNNLNHICSNQYSDQQGKEYTFNGNHTVISSTISGHDLLKLRTEKE